MKLYAISDLHLGYRTNRLALLDLPEHHDDWLILAGDVSETELYFRFALKTLTERFARVLWTPGNHDLWTLPGDLDGLRGQAKYRRLVSIAREYGVVTPEDPYVSWPGAGSPSVLALLFTLYDYSFRPHDVSEERVIEWAVESGVLCRDESLLHCSPYSSKAAWCAMRCEETERRLAEVPQGTPLVLINHFPMAERFVRLSRIPRFSIWCGTRRTEDWHKRFSASVVVYGHLHLRATDFEDDVRFEEVSLGYPAHWDQSRGIQHYLREILPGPQSRQ